MNPPEPTSLRSPAPRAPWIGYGAAVVACALTAGIASLLTSAFDLANIVMLFLLAVVLVAVGFGRGPGVLASFLSVALFDFFFVPPTLSFTVADVQYLLTFGVMLVVALIIAHLTAGLKNQAHEASIREQQTRALYEMSRELAGALATIQVAEIVQNFVATIGADATLVLLDRNGAIAHSSDLPQRGFGHDRRSMDASARSGEFAAFDGVGYFPVKTRERVHGVLAITFGGHPALLQEHRELLDTVASLCAIVVERLHYVEVADTHELAVQDERLRSSILSALSHDIRTPLTALTGLADSLTMSKPTLPERQLELASAIRSQAMRLSELVSNLLDMAKLNAGVIRLRKEWQPLEEVIGSSLALLAPSLGQRNVRISLPSDLPLLQFDSVLIERVFCNLIENAAKYSPEGTEIVIAASNDGNHVRITVCDQGAGVPVIERDRIFAMFVRGERESSRPGVGLGLAICRAIVGAHDGTIRVEETADGSACFAFTLPKGNPPAIVAEPLPVGHA